MIVFAHEFINVIVDQVVFENSHKMRLDVITEELNDLPCLIEFLLYHVLAHELDKLVPAPVEQGCVYLFRCPKLFTLGHAVVATDRGRFGFKLLLHSDVSFGQTRSA